MNIGMVGPSAEGTGGIASVVTSWTASEALVGCSVRYFPTMATGSRRRKVAVAGLGLSSFVAALGGRGRPQLAHIHVGGMRSLARKAPFLVLANAAGVPTIVHLHGSNTIEAFAARSPRHLAAVRAFLRRATAIVTVSEQMRAVVQEWAPGAKVLRLYNPVDARRFDEVLHRPGPERPTVLYMGDLVGRKGVFDLLDAVEAIAPSIPGLRVRMCGKGPAEERLAAEAERRGLAGVIELPGWVRGQAWMDAFADADVFCLPSHSEGLPVSVLEAMAAGLPVVATAIAGIPEAVPEGVAGFLVPPHRPDLLAARLRTVLLDADLRRAMGAAGRRRVETTFDREVVAQELRRAWTDLTRSST